MRAISQDAAPCVLHKYHSPITVQNELHHPYPQEWQKEVWGEVRDDRLVSLCATSHNSIHVALRAWRRDGRWPDWCVGAMRDLCERAVELHQEALKSQEASQ